MLVSLLGLGVACGGAAFTSVGRDDGGSGSESGAGGGSSSGDNGSSSGGGSSNGGNSSSGGGGSSGGGSSGGSTGSSGGCIGCVDGGPPTLCPAQVPTAGHGCAHDGLVCEYGASTVESCNTVATCSQSQWQVQSPGASMNCASSPGPMCPASYSAVPRNMHCSNFDLVCDYPEGRCACEALGGPVPLDASAAARWACQDPGSGNCPTPRPLLGSACNQAGVTCNYGACSVPGGSAEQCNNGIWTPAAIPCPL
jgi:hypothetical protein